MAKWLGAALFAVALLIVQTTAVGHIELFEVRPMLVLALVVSTALVFGYVPSLAAGILLGFMFDMLSGGLFFGINTLLFMYVGILSSKLCGSVFREKVIVVAWFTFWACFFYSVMYNFSLFFLLGRFGDIGSVLKKAFAESLYTSVAGIPVFFAVKFSRRIFLSSNISKINFLK